GISGVSAAVSTHGMERVRAQVAATAAALGQPLRFRVGKPGLDGHSNGAEQIAIRARDAGFEVVYQGIRLSPEQIVAAAVEEDVDVVGLSILSGSHRDLVPAVLEGLRAAGAGEVPLVVGGIIPQDDAQWLIGIGVRAVFTPRDYDATAIMDRVLAVVREANGLPVQEQECAS
ncbi:MAG: cobalamin B12-binding domain-containing protein, partial [Actinomycetales bacterium]